MRTDLWSLYLIMKKSRLYEEEVAQLWKAGLISGEMHLGTGEEAIIAGVVSQLTPSDALALDHRGTSALLMRGVDPVALLRELLGRQDGLCGGRGGHMHLLSREHCAASSGIVGSAGPAAAGFAMALQYLHRERIAVAFFGEGAMDQGMMMEALLLAADWNLPAIFVCKDDGWAITTQAGIASRQPMADRVRGLGVRYVALDGLDVGQVWGVAADAIARARAGKGPTFLHARCIHLEGHMLGLPLLRIVRHPLKELPRVAGPLLRFFVAAGGGPFRERLAGLAMVTSTILSTLRDPRRRQSNDPLVRARAGLRVDPARLQALDDQARAEVSAIVAAALQEA
jgi:TPP-dependent pyruvate/acetoin dehydrogenase alpha subunit